MSYTFEVATPANTATVTIHNKRTDATTTVHTSAHPASVGKVIVDTARRWNANVFALEIGVAWPDGSMCIGSVRDLSAFMNDKVGKVAA